MAKLRIVDYGRFAALLELYGYWLVDGALVSSKQASFGDADASFVNERVGRLSADVTRQLFATPSRNVRVGEWVWSLSRASLERVVVGVRAAARGAASVAVADAGLRDDLVRLFLHAGMSATCDAAGTVSFGNALSVAEPALQLVSDNVREFKNDGRTWCFDMSSDGVRNDGFIVVRRASATGEASRATIQGNCFQQPGYYQHVMEFAREDLGIPDPSPSDFPPVD
jgi:hypothetical protein